MHKVQRDYLLAKTRYEAATEQHRRGTAAHREAIATATGTDTESRRVERLPEHTAFSVKLWQELGIDNLLEERRLAKEALIAWVQKTLEVRYKDHPQWAAVLELLGNRGQRHPLLFEEVIEACLTLRVPPDGAEGI